MFKMLEEKNVQNSTFSEKYLSKCKLQNLSVMQKLKFINSRFALQEMLEDALQQNENDTRNMEKILHKTP